MALGVYREIENSDRRFGTHDSYLFLKVQSGNTEADEEHWLVTASEAAEFTNRAYKNVEDWAGAGRGNISKVANAEHKFGEGSHYFHVLVKPKGGEVEHWLLTDHDLQVVRARSVTNAEDIEANKEGWLADLFD